MQYAAMVDLLAAAKQAGEKRTEHVNEALALAFDAWLDEQELGELTDEEYDALRLAFEEGYGICVHRSV
jgi:predicted DNA binding protein